MNDVSWLSALTGIGIDSDRFRAVRWVMAVAAAAAMAGCQRTVTNYPQDPPEDDKYQVVVTAPSGKPAKGAVVTLHYDPVLTYNPARFRTGDDGKVSLPHRYALAKNWEAIIVSYPPEGGHRYIMRSEVTWPLEVKLLQGRK